MANQASDNISVISFTIVIVSPGLDPSQYSAEYFAKEKIVPDDFKVSGRGGVANLAKVVLYKDGIYTIKAEPSRFTIEQNVASSEDPLDPAVVVSIARNFLEGHKHLNFTAMGVNFAAVLRNVSERFIIDHIVREELQTLGGYSLSGAGARLTFDVDDAVLNLSLDSGGATVKKKGGVINEIEGLVFQANFHRPYRVEAETSAIVKDLNLVDSYRDALLRIIDELEQRRNA